MKNEVYGYRQDGSAINKSYAEKNVSSWISEAVSFTEIGMSVAQMTLDMLKSSGEINSMDTLKSEAQRLKSQL